MIPFWNRDPAASGWRSRVWLFGAELHVYDTGDWFVELPNSLQQGVASSVWQAKLIAICIAVVFS